jgi:hypothetical protein
MLPNAPYDSCPTWMSSCVRHGDGPETRSVFVAFGGCINCVDDESTSSSLVWVFGLVFLIN